MSTPPKVREIATTIHQGFGKEGCARAKSKAKDKEARNYRAHDAFKKEIVSACATSS